MKGLRYRLTPKWPKGIRIKSHRRRPSPVLPIEIIQRIVECLIPEKTPVPVAFALNSTVPKTLLSFRRTCKATSLVALRLLLQHCLWIDGERQLELVMRTLDSDNGQRATCGSDVNEHGTGLFLVLAPEDPAMEVRLSSLVEKLFGRLAPYIRRLVIARFPLTPYFSEESNQLQLTLQRDVRWMPKLEEFCRGGNDYVAHTDNFLHMDLSQPNPGCKPLVWSLWPRLRYLALTGTDVICPLFLDTLKQSSKLQHLVLATPWHLQDLCRSNECLRHGGFQLERLTIVNDCDANLYDWGPWPVCQDFLEGRSRHWTDWPDRLDFLEAQTSGRTLLEDSGRVRGQGEVSSLESGPALRCISLPNVKRFVNKAPSPDEFVRYHALASNLWDLEGRVITPGKCQCLGSGSEAEV